MVLVGWQLVIVHLLGELKIREMKDKITFDEFLEIETKLEIRVGEIRSVERVPKSDKMLKLTVSFGDDDERTVLTNIGNRIEDIDMLVNMILPFITNLEPAKMMGIMSEAMIMLPENKDGDIEIDDVTLGSTIM